MSHTHANEDKNMLMFAYACWQFYWQLVCNFSFLLLGLFKIFFCWQWLTVRNQLTWAMLQYLTMGQHLKRQSTTHVKLDSGPQMGPNFLWGHATTQETGRGPTRHVKVRTVFINAVFKYVFILWLIYITEVGRGVNTVYKCVIFIYKTR